MKLLFFTLGMMFFSAGAVLAQNGASSPGKSTLPFGIGEQLAFKGELDKIIRGLDFGDMTFTVIPNPGTEGFIIRSEAKSRGTLLALLRFSFLQKYDSVVATSTLRADRTVKFDQQRQRVRESETVFDYENRRVTFTERNPKTPLNAPRVIASDLPGDTHDIITGIYALRTLPLEVGKSFDVTVSDSGLVYRIPVTVTAREYQRTVLGRVMCFRLEPKVFGKDRFIEDEGSMVIWVTDTPQRIPIRSRIETGLGKVDIKLKSYRPASATATTTAAR